MRLEDRQTLKRNCARMTTRQRAFCHEYLKDLNQAAAARRAGYSENRSRTTGYQLLQLDYITETVEILKAEREARTLVTADRVVMELAKIAFADPHGLIEVLGPTGEVITAAPEVTMAEKLRALEALGKHTAIFTDNLNITSNGETLQAAPQVVNVVIQHRLADGSVENAG